MTRIFTDLMMFLAALLLVACGGSDADVGASGATSGHVGTSGSSGRIGSSGAAGSIVSDSSTVVDASPIVDAPVIVDVVTPPPVDATPRVDASPPPPVDASTPPPSASYCFCDFASNLCSHIDPVTRIFIDDPACLTTSLCFVYEGKFTSSCKGFPTQTQCDTYRAKAYPISEVRVFAKYDPCRTFALTAK